MSGSAIDAMTTRKISLCDDLQADSEDGEHSCDRLVLDPYSLPITQSATALRIWELPRIQHGPKSSTEIEFSP